MNIQTNTQPHKQKTHKQTTNKQTNNKQPIHQTNKHTRTSKQEQANKQTNKQRRKVPSPTTTARRAQIFKHTINKHILKVSSTTKTTGRPDARIECGTPWKKKEE
jgi:hypothetical protein